VSAVAAQLTEKYNLPYFKKGPRLADFIAIGDEDGLLLLSQNTRPWVPTNKSAQHFPVKIKLDNDLLEF